MGGMDESSMIHNRRSRRSPVLLTATVDVDGAAQPVKLRNLSEQGALIEGEAVPAEGSRTVFRRNDLKLQSEVVWVHGKYAGIAFDEPLERTDVLRQVPQREARPVPPQLYARPAVSRHQLSAAERRWIEDWVSASGFDRLGE
jgi:hypothetical protein